MTDDRQMERLKKLGQQVEKFLKSEAGRYLLQCCDAETRRGLELLRKVDPEDAKAIRAAQNCCELGRLMKEWLQEAVVAGLNAEELLRERD